MGSEMDVPIARMRGAPSLFDALGQIPPTEADHNPTDQSSEGVQVAIEPPLKPEAVQVGV